MKGIKVVFLASDGREYVFQTDALTTQDAYMVASEELIRQFPFLTIYEFWTE